MIELLLHACTFLCMLNYKSKPLDLSFHLGPAPCVVEKVKVKRKSTAVEHTSIFNALFEEI